MGLGNYIETTLPLTKRKHMNNIKTKINANITSHSNSLSSLLKERKEKQEIAQLTKKIQKYINNEEINTLHNNTTNDCKTLNIIINDLQRQIKQFYTCLSVLTQLEYEPGTNDSVSE